jgi:hypothetical protein
MGLVQLRLHLRGQATMLTSLLLLAEVAQAVSAVVVEVVVDLGLNQALLRPEQTTV